MAALSGVGSIFSVLEGLLSMGGGIADRIAAYKTEKGRKHEVREASDKSFKALSRLLGTIRPGMLEGIAQNRAAQEGMVASGRGLVRGYLPGKQRRRTHSLSLSDALSPNFGKRISSIGKSMFGKSRTPHMPALPQHREIDPETGEIKWVQNKFKLGPSVSDILRYKVKPGSYASRFAPVGALTPGVRSEHSGLGMDQEIFDARRMLYENLSKEFYGEEEKATLSGIANLAAGEQMNQLNVRGATSGAGLAGKLGAGALGSAGVGSAGVMVQTALANRSLQREAATGTQTFLGNLYGVAGGTF